MEPEHIFRFNCNPGIPCFTQCCQDITIVLTPYDILRMKKNLGISSDEFLEKYTLIVPKEKHVIPLIILKMNEEDKKCPFVSEKGCDVYEDRPWPCRMYPLDVNDDGTFSVIAASSKCQGLTMEDEWKISDWLHDQGITPYEKRNEQLSELTISLSTWQLDIDNPKVTKMVTMALYNLDKLLVRHLFFAPTSPAAVN